MSQFFNVSSGPVTATSDGSVVVFPPKQWTTIPGNSGISESINGLVKRGVLIPAPEKTVNVSAKASKPRVQPNAAPPKKAPAKDPKPKKAEARKPEKAPAKSEPKPASKPEPKPEPKPELLLEAAPPATSDAPAASPSEDPLH